MKKVIIFVFILLLVSCTYNFKPTPEQYSSADFGAYPSDYENIVRAYFSRSLFDPYTAVYTFESPVKGRIGGGPSPFGWIACGTLNAKNRMGGYVGANDYLVKIYNGVAYNGFRGSIAREICDQLQK